MRGPSYDAASVFVPAFARRGLSDAPSHDDFSPRKKVDTSNDTEDAIRDLIDAHVKSNRVMLYMKGSPSQPMCGFSATVVSILKRSGVDFSSVNVLDYPEVREGVKKYSQWPTIPQLYVDGEFVGGCDIVRDMDESGELTELLRPADGGDAKEGAKE
jgi:monothiol glutaredoxin